LTNKAGRESALLFLLDDAVSFRAPIDR